MSRGRVKKPMNGKLLLLKCKWHLIMGNLYIYLGKFFYRLADKHSKAGLDMCDRFDHQ